MDFKKNLILGEESAGKMMRAFWGFLAIFICIHQLEAQQIILPVEVLGAEGTSASRTFALSESEANSARSVWLQVNNLSYENKGFIQINGGQPISLNHQTTKIPIQENARGGMVHGGFSTIRLTVPISGFVAGENTVTFYFNQSDGISIGYRVVKLNILDNAGNQILPEIAFSDEDPMTWEAPYTDATSIAEGKDLWNNASLWSNYLEENTTGKWYAYELESSVPIKATCSDCHVSNGFDLEYFSYSNESIIERSKFHKLSEEDGKKIASYIRSLSSEVEGLARHGRPWNPPYQPGPELENKTLDEWAAGAGLDAVLEKDEDMFPYMFPNGTDSLEIAKYFDSERVEDHTLMPLAVQLPDWKHWLPIVHPMDAFSKDDFYNTTNVNIHPKLGLENMEAFLGEMPLADRNIDDLKNQLRSFHRHFRHFMDQASGEVRHWRTGGDALRENKYNERVAAIPDEIPVELAVTSLARLLAVKNFEIMNLHDLQDKAKWFASEEDYKELTPRGWQWVGEDYNVFEVPPHFTSCVTTVNCDNFVGQSVETGHYESTAWYQLQLVLNGGNGNVGGNHPMDWQYQLDFIKRASYSSQLPEPMRYYHSLNAMYRLRTYDRNKGPNSGNAFRARQMLPHWFYGMDDSNSFSGFEPGAFPTYLDDIQPGLQRSFVNALLRQFLTEMDKPENALSGWNRRSPHGGSNELEPASKTGALVNVESTTGLYYYTDKMYYLIPKFAALGIDCDVITRLIDWSAEAWPNYNWDQFRSLTQPSVTLSYVDEAQCGELPTYFKAVASNEGANPLFEWRVNGLLQAKSGEEFYYEDIQAGDEISVKVVGSQSCTSIKEAISIYGAPHNDFNVLVSQNNGEWTSADQITVCDNDQINVKLDVSLKPLLWLDALQLSNETLDKGAEVASWLDRSGNDYPVSADNSSLYPSYDPEGFNGMPAVMFGMNNNADGLRLFSTANDDFMEENWTMVLIGEEYGINNWADVVGNKTESKYDDGWFLRFSEGGQSEISGGGAYYRGGIRNLPFQFIAVMKKEDRKVSLYINGSFERSLTMEDGEMITTNNEIFLGLSDKGNANSSRYHRGPIAEVMFYDYAMGDNERSIVEGYLGHKWQMNDELALSHAYASYSPFDINIQLPDYSIVGLDAQNTSYSYTIDEFSAGSVAFFDPSNECAGSSYTMETVYPFDRNNQQVAVQYSLNNAPLQKSTSIVVRDGDQLTLTPSEVYGDYAWETPVGDLLSLNTDPQIASIQDGDSIGTWKLHTDLGVCLSNHEVLSLFEVSLTDQPRLVVSVELVGSGASSISGEQLVNSGNDLILELTPDQGHKVGEIRIDQVSQAFPANNGESMIYRLSNVTSSQELEIVFAARAQHYITLTLSDGGSATSGQGTYSVYEGESWATTIQSSAGFRIANVVLDGKNQGPASMFAIDEVYANYEVDILFEQFQYEVLAQAGKNGTISSAGITTVGHGEDKTFTITPNEGYEVDRVYINGDYSGDPMEYKFLDIQSNQSIFATFTLAPVYFNMTIVQSDFGTITPESASVLEGDDVRFTIEPIDGYYIADVLVDDQSVGAVDSYEIRNVSETHKIEAIFEKVAPLGSADLAYSIYPNPIIREFNITTEQSIKGIELFGLDGQSLIFSTSDDLRKVFIKSPLAHASIVLVRVTLESGLIINDKLIVGQ